MVEGQTPVLDLETAAKLNKNGHKETVQCAIRGCVDEGLYFLRRVTRGGRTRCGLYCEEHEKVYGRDNLKKWADESNGKVVTMADTEGMFEGVVF